MKNVLSRIRLPFRDDTVFSLLMLTVFVVPLVFTLLTFEKFETLKLSLWLILVGSAWGIYLVRQRSRQEGIVPMSVPQPSKPFWIALGLFCIWAVLATVHSADWINSVTGFYSRFSSSIIVYVLWVATIVLLVVTFTRERIIFIVKLLIVDALIVAIIAVLQSMGVALYEGLDAPSFLRAPSLLGNPNFTTMFLAVLIPLMTVFFLQAKSLPVRIYYAVTAFVSLWAMVLLSSRGAWAALLSSLVVIGILAALYRFPKKYIAAIAMVGIVGFGMAYAFISVTRPNVVVDTVVHADSNVSQRLFVWDIARLGIMQHPWLGNGPGNFHLTYEQFRGKNLAAENSVYDDAHNLLLQLAVGGGVPLALLFIIIFGLACWSAYNGVKKDHDVLMLGVLGGLVAFIIAASFTPVPVSCLLLLAVLYAIAIARQPNDVVVPLVSWFSIPGIVVGIGAVIIGVLFLSADIIFFRGYTAYYTQNMERAYTLTTLATKLNPTNQFYLLYKTGSEIYLGKDASQIDRDIARMIQLHPTTAKTYVAAANLDFLRYGITRAPIFLDAAIQHMGTAIQHDIYFSERYGYQAYYYFLRNDNKTGLEYVKYGLSLDPDNIPSLLLLARIYQVDERRAGFLSVLHHLVTLRPTSLLFKKIMSDAEGDPGVSKVTIPLGVVPGSLPTQP